MHTNADEAGSPKKMGHVNIFVNTGDTQPACPTRPTEDLQGKNQIKAN